MVLWYSFLENKNLYQGASLDLLLKRRIPFYLGYAFQRKKRTSAMNAKAKAAFGSLMVAIFLTAIKLIAGVLTNSLAIISEALHSGIDLIAAAMTLFAVSKSDLPPDSGHLYGHYKLENVSSFVETLLLYITAIWILYEALDRLLFGGAVVEMSIWGVAIMLLSIVLNFSRARVLYRTAKKYKSQALEADAVHFMADFITSVVVIIGIVLAYFGLTEFDSIAAVGVAIIIAIIGFRIGKKSLASLMDAAPAGLERLISEEVRKIEGVGKIDRIRVRESGHRVFVDISAFIDQAFPFEVAHGITETISDRIQAVVPDSDILVHAEPFLPQRSSLLDKIRFEASSFPEIKNIHNIKVLEINNKLYVEFHAELEGNLPLTKAHEVMTNLESRIASLDRNVCTVSSHLEPIDNKPNGNESSPSIDARIAEGIESILKSHPEVHSFEIQNTIKIDGKYAVALRCLFTPTINVHDCHALASKIEQTIKLKLPEVASVTIHQEPSQMS
jgi:cation diffusion facilitator family transporter